MKQLLLLIMLILLILVVTTGCGPATPTQKTKYCYNLGDFFDAIFICKVKIGNKDYCYMERNHSGVSIGCEDFNAQMKKILPGANQ